MLSPGEVNVKVMAPSNGSYLVFTIIDGEIEKVVDIVGETPLHNIYTVFSAPPSQWWKDVRFACSGIQICTSKHEAESWHTRHTFHYGDVITLDQLWELSKVFVHYTIGGVKLMMSIGMVFREG